MKALVKSWNPVRSRRKIVLSRRIVRALVVSSAATLSVAFSGVIAAVFYGAQSFREATPWWIQVIAAATVAGALARLSMNARGAFARARIVWGVWVRRLESLS